VYTSFKIRSVTIEWTRIKLRLLHGDVAVRISMGLVLLLLRDTLTCRQPHNAACQQHGSI